MVVSGGVTGCKKRAIIGKTPKVWYASTVSYRAVNKGGSYKSHKNFKHRYEQYKIF